MDVNNVLNSFLQVCIREVRSDPQHDLKLGYRRGIWMRLGPRYEQGPRSVSVGLKRRVRLGITTVQFVLPIWKAARGNEDTLPEDALRCAEQVLGDEISENGALAIREEMWTSLDDLAFENYELQIPLAVGYGALQVLLCAIRDELFDASSENLNVSDRGVDPDELDSSFMAAAAHAGGAIWDSESDPLRRLAFWEWWLLQAVPAAYETDKA